MELAPARHTLTLHAALAVADDGQKPDRFPGGDAAVGAGLAPPVSPPGRPPGGASPAPTNGVARLRGRDPRTREEPPVADTSFDLIVVGGGPGGYVAAIRAAQLGMKAEIGRAHV